VVAGHICVDLRPRLHGQAPIAPGLLSEVGPLAVAPGGCVGNTGLALAALGVPTRLVADVGDDELGRVLAELLAARGACADLAVVPGAATSYSVVIEPPGVDRSFWHHAGANAGFDGARVEVGGAAVVHIGYPTLLPGLARHGGAPLVELLRRFRAAGATVSIDLSTVADGHDWADVVSAALPHADVVTPSIDDLVSIFAGDAEPPEWAEALVKAGAAVALVTAGEQGMFLRTAGRERLEGAGGALWPLAQAWADAELWAPAPIVDVASTTGAGDAAAAGLLAGMLSCDGPEEALLLAVSAAASRITGAAASSVVLRPARRPGWTATTGGVLHGPRHGIHR
jgi:sugar/nucleoside kinase (ribokinase family)